MRKTFVGLLSIVLVLASVFGLSSRGPRARHDARSDRGADWALWV